MAAQQLTCPGCKASLRFSGEFDAKKKIKCPKCATVFVIGSAVNGRPPAEEKVSARRPAPPPARDNEPDEDDDTPRRAEKPAKKKGKGKKGAKSKGMSPAVLWGAVGGGVAVVVALVIVIIATSGGGGPPKVAQGPPIVQPGPEAPDDGQPPNPIPKPEPGPAPGLPPDDGDPPDEPGFQRVNLDTLTGNEKPVLVLDPGGHSNRVGRALLTPDGRRLVTASADRTIRVWDMRSGDTLQTIHMPSGAGREGALHTAAMTGDGRRLAVAGHPFGDGVYGIPIYVLSLPSGRVERVFDGHKGIIHYLEFSRDGRYLASGSADNSAAVWDLQTGKPVRHFVGHTAGVRRVHFSADGRHVATASQDDTVRVWAMADGAAVAHLRAPDAKLLSVAWSPDGATLATGAVEGTIHLWGLDGNRRKQHKVVPGKNVQIADLVYSADGAELLFGGIDNYGEAGVFNLASGQVRVAFKKHTNTVVSVAYSADGALAVTSGGDEDETYVWSVKDGAVVRKIVGRGKSTWAVGWGRDGKTIAWGQTNRGDTTTPTTPLESTFDLERLAMGPPPAADALRVPPSVDGYSLHALDFFRVAIKKNGQQVHVFEPKDKGDRIYSFSLIGGHRAVIGASYGMYLIDVRTNQILRTFRTQSGSVMGVSPSPDGKYFLTAEGQGVRLWSPDRNDPLLTLFPAGRDWIAWTQEGYYACSASGERLMGWQVNHGAEKTASFYPAARFRASLYRPDAIKLILATGDVQQAIAKANQGKPQAPVVANVGQVLPPAVAFTAPVGGGEAKVEQGTVEVKAIARSTGNHPVTAMRLLVNGRPYQGDKGVRAFADPKLGEVQASWTVELQPGRQILHVMAESQVSKGVSSPIAVNLTNAKPSDLPNLYVLAVGINDYPGEMVLNCATNDARAIVKVFTEKTKGVFRKVESRLVTDKEATKAKIFEGLAWLKTVMTPRDVAVVFFAGHGGLDRKGAFFLIPVDINEDDVAGSCVADKDFKRALANLPGRVVAMLDACHSGSVAGKSRDASADDLVRDLVSEDIGVVVMCSSQGNEYSMENPKLKHGFFTLGLIDGLSGEADLNRDQYVYIHEVDLYASVFVQRLSRGQQNPVTGRPPNIRSFPLARP